MNHLTRQQKRVLSFIEANRGCTTRDIQQGTGIECPSARITEMRKAGIPIISIGKKRYPGAHSFEMYALEGATRTETRVEVVEVDGMVARKVAVSS